MAGYLEVAGMGCVCVCFPFGPLRACSHALCFLEGSKGSSDVADREKRMALLSER